MEWIAHTIDDLTFIAKELLEQIGQRKVVAFDAEMGAGKTTFIQVLLRAMGIQDLAGSPTYAIVNGYESSYYGDVFHFDVYRLVSIEEAIGIGMEEMLYSGAFCFIEWAEKVAVLLPEDTLFVRITVNDMGERLFQLSSKS